MSNYTKLKTNLKLAIQRLKLLGKKKTEQSLKSRKEIADYIQMNKPDRARIRVEHIIREDNMVEGLEMIEMFCDLLLARFGLIEKMKELDPGLDEAIATVIWASPRISNDVQEFKIISEIFAHKYGKKYADACKADSLNNVNDKVKRKLGVEPPPKILVENYLIEIAKNFNINYEPDKTVMLQSGQMDEELISLRDKTNEIIKKSGGNGGSGGASGGASGGGGGSGGGAEAIDPTVPSRPIGFESEKNRKNLIDLSDDDDDDDGGDVRDLNNNIVNSDKENPSAPPLPTSLPFGEVNRRVPSPPPNYSRLLNAPKSSTNNVQFRQSNLPPYPQQYGDEKKQPPSGFNEDEQAPPLPDKSHEFHNNQAAPSPNFMSMPPSYYQSNEDEKRPSSGSNKAPPPADFDDDLGLPSVPDTHPDSNVGGGARGGSGGGSGGNVDPTKSIDFDDLARRFENLKSKK